MNKNRSDFHHGTQTNLKFKNATVIIEDAQMLATNDVALVQLECCINGVYFRTVGSAKRFKGDGKVKADRPNKDVGLGLATSRALFQMAKKIERQALGLNKHDENMRAIKAKKEKKANG